MTIRYYAAESICYHIEFLLQYEMIFFNDEEKEKKTDRFDHVIRIYV